MSLVAARDLTKEYEVGEIRISALRGLNFDVEPSSFISFVGPSGSGKTTSLNLIGCLDKRRPIYRNEKPAIFKWPMR